MSMTGHDGGGWDRSSRPSGRAIVVMFDSLNRRHLPPYGCDDVAAPNFERLAQRTATFDTCYAGSMPCMPARREMHTGRHSFLHRSWSPLEPFDDSVPQLLSEAGVYTHLVTDHYHYWQDGGATYHNRFDSCELVRGQEADRWKGQVAEPVTDEVIRRQRRRRRFHTVNRPHVAAEERHPQTVTFDLGLEFLEANHEQDGWLLQIETFDPHEPFVSPDRYHALYPDEYDGPRFEWPEYGRVSETDAQVAHARNRYRALLSMCDRSLGRVLDAMDRHELWHDTMLIVCTDHGYMLGERGLWAKFYAPWFQDTIHTPLFAWDPRSAIAGERRGSLVQTIDLGPTLLERFGLEPTPDMQGRPLRETIAADRPVRAAGLFGSFGAHVNVTDGRYVYMRAPARADDEPLAEYGLTFTRMDSRFAPEDLREAEFCPPLPFTKGVPVMRAPVHGYEIDAHRFGTLMFDLEADPEQREPLSDDALELRLATLLRDLMRDADAPPEQYERLGLPADGPLTDAHLLVARQSDLARRALRPAHRVDEFPAGPRTVNASLRELVADPDASEVVARERPELLDRGLPSEVAGLTLVEIAALAPRLLADEQLEAIDAALRALERG